MTGTTYAFARGVRLRREPDGSAMLLVPEGIVELNDTAAAALELAEGGRSLDDIVAALADRFDAPDDELRADVGALLDELVSRGYLAR